VLIIFRQISRTRRIKSTKQLRTKTSGSTRKSENKKMSMRMDILKKNHLILRKVYKLELMKQFSI
jgi:hypothetical protein